MGPPQAERRPELCVGAGGDSTDHAIQQREGLRTRLEKRGLQPGLMLIYGCVRHFKQLELNAAFEAGWPGKQAENFLLLAAGCDPQGPRLLARHLAQRARPWGRGGVAARRVQALPARHERADWLQMGGPSLAIHAMPHGPHPLTLSVPM